MSSPKPSSLAAEAFAVDLLPTEVVANVFSWLPNSDIKALRLTSRRCHEIASAHFRLDRVFLSPNPLNIRVFRKVAGHEKLRLGVREIVWDDAPLMKKIELGWGELDDETMEHEYTLADNPEPPEGVPYWFAYAYVEETDELKIRRRYDGRDCQRPEHVARMKQLEAQLPLDEAWAYHQELVRQQDEVMAAEADGTALEDALEHGYFPNLKRITITPAAHGILFTPLYQTPMIRSFPYGFVYPVPRGWPCPRSNVGLGSWGWDHGETFDFWRGFSIVTRILARRKDTNVPELVLDVNHLRTGLQSRMFSNDGPNQHYDNLVEILKRPGFSRLDLPVLVGGQMYEGWPSLRSPRLREALECAPDMEHVSFRTGIDEHPGRMYGDAPNTPEIDHEAHFVPLASLFPVATWSNLRHFGLARLMVKQEDLLALLGAMPETLRSVEFSFLYFLSGGGSFKGLLAGIRNELGWRERAVRPRISIAQESNHDLDGRYFWVDEEVNDYVYGNGANPFAIDPCGSVVRNYHGIGIERDAFDSGHEKRNQVRTVAFFDPRDYQKSSTNVSGS
ncbi:hypothetical protein CMUS01_07990 [Colletotrichum musicola]|uniref:F-box domain-containing protein n=1 Tax=Colletotrichum musicola TaxID=2175873 RepID=A0A8H6NDV5_9PEZI|nr:hypothetical protein CMUS01_07990 [Colletotrichum musicola]